MFNVVLVEPEIPHNTGNIARTCVAMNCHLHLVGPLGFSLDEKQVRRAGLDYWPHLRMTQHTSWREFLERCSAPEKLVYFSTKAQRDIFDFAFSAEAWLVFGPETRGLDESLITAHPDRAARIPMVGQVRSLNLSNAVAVAVYEAHRQCR